MNSLLDDLPRAKWDIEFFAWRFFGVRLHPGEIRFAKAVLARNPTGWRPLFLTIIVSAGNRAGKTLALAIIIFHSCLFKINHPPPDELDDASVRTWMRAPYDWYHFGIQQEVAELVFNELVRIFESRHVAQQGRMCPITEELGNEVVKYDKKYRGEYPWIVIHETLGGATIHFRSTTEKAIGSLGKSMDGVSMDEPGFEPNLPFIVNEVFQMRRLSTGGQLILASTPSEGFTDFADVWEQGNPDNPLRTPGYYSMFMSTRDNIGFGITQEMFDSLIASMPPDLIPQNIDGQFIQGTKAFFNAKAVDFIFVPELPEESPVVRGNDYVQGIDPALTFDNTISIVLDATDRDHVAGVSMRRLRGRQTTLSVSSLAHEQHERYALGNTSTGVDVTGMGGKVFKEMLGGLPGLKGVEFGGTAKNKLMLLVDLKGMIEQGKLRFPRSGLWLELRRQLLAYRLQDRNIEQDAVMALAIAVKLVLRLSPRDAVAALEFSFFRPTAVQKEDRFMQMVRRRGTVTTLGDIIQ